MAMASLGDGEQVKTTAYAYDKSNIGVTNMKSGFTPKADLLRRSL